MKSIFTLTLSFILMGATQASAKTRQITITTAINSSPEKVWQTLVDFKNYQAWNQWVIKIKGAAKLGSKVRAFAKNGLSLRLKITKLEANKEICWVDISWFTNFGVGGWRCRRIASNPDGEGVLLINHFEYTGTFARSFERSTRQWLTNGMSLENENLKNFLEKDHQ